MRGRSMKSKTYIIPPNVQPTITTSPGVKIKKICSVCNGNGFIRVPFEQAREEQWADCTFCNNQGEIEVEEDEDDTVQRETNH